MQIYFKQKFIKQYQKLKKTDQAKVDFTLKLFEKNPYGSKLRNHPLQGKLIGKRSISAGFDLRIVFEMQQDYLVVIMLGVGTHNQVY